MKPKQIRALKYLILASQDITSPLTRPLLFFLLNESKSLTKGVYVTLWEGDKGGFTEREIMQVQRDFNAVCSTNNTTLIQQILAAMGSRFEFLNQYGHLDLSKPEKIDGSNQKIGQQRQRFRATFWLTRDAQLTKATRKLLVDRRSLKKIPLRSHLYSGSDLEPE